VTDTTEWANLSTGAFCWYDNDNQYEIPYGKLYNWHAVDDSRNLCPVGWHVPTDDEWTVLVGYLGVDSIAGGKMKSTGTIQAGTGLWNEPNGGATNESGFSGLPGGYRTSNGNFNSLGNGGFWWSATESDASSAWNRLLYYNSAFVARLNGLKAYGLSCRCVRD
ncbi:MAG: hypothetical protein GY753_00375, partial [Gammaproteobacteria bacterium]|nr:hypothetical protein [Gammaproteobacteria bacterium]